MNAPATPAARGASLARHNVVLLALVFVVFEVLVAAAVVGFLVLPMARRSADDLAGLMLLSAHTWGVLSSEARPAFELELSRSTLLALRDRPPRTGAEDEGGWRNPYVYFLEKALAKKTGRVQHFLQESRDGKDWFWIILPSGENSVAVGFPSRRIGKLLRILLFTAGSGLLLALLSALWLARRTVAPLARLEQAVADVGRGEIPELLPETGPRELATLAHRFNQMTIQVQELLAARTTLLAGISHDLRTPLARMRLALALLAEKPAPALIARLENDIEEMNKLIGEVLGLARGLSREPAARIDLAALLSDMAGGAATGAVRLALSAAPPRVHAAPLALRRALGNLLDNALRYGAGQPVELVVEHDKTWVRIGVLDRGPGIPEGQLEAVFQPFHRVESSRSPVTGGAGLGLAITRQLAAANGWRIELRNRFGNGLEAWLSLPTGNPG
ncbi:MAG: HAMP domain-containing protein [Betaproteobacteria bacterium]|nr:HAMP domain-containing protein [Betaproteobacteria bacterium]